jgi:hypothetical protein
MLAPSDPAPLTFGHLRFLPVLPGAMEFAAAIRHALLRERPEVVCVELPMSLEQAYRRAVRRLPEISVIFYEGAEEDEMIYVPVEPADPFTEAVRTALELEAEIVFIEPDLRPKPHLSDPAPDSYVLHAVGYDRLVAMYRKERKPAGPNVHAHAAAVAWKLQGADPSRRTSVVLSLNLLDAVLGAMETPQEDPDIGKPKREVELVNPHPESLSEILVEYPYLQSRYEDYRVLLDDVAQIDRPHVQLDVLKHAETTYEKNTGDKLAYWHRRLIAKYSRNLAMITGELTCGVFDMCVAARSIVDDNYGWEVWESASRYPAQQERSDLETVHLSAEEVYRGSKRVRLRRRLPRQKQQLRPSGLKKRKKEKFEGEWAEQLNGNAICSYPPEDFVIENYGRFLKQRAKSILSEERERVEAFTTSLLDGIDIRETIRNWHERKIYVRHQERIQGDVGSLVVIFDEDRDGERYPWLTTWLGEHQNESDMSFYSTDPFSHMVGPGIGRAEYGGFLMSLPPRRMYDVWSDPDYDVAETKAERLLLAGIDYSIGKLVVYVAPKPPRSVFRSLAARMGHQILYIPLGQLSSDKLKRVRVVHVLDGYDRREEAKDYIW